jgi:hypothetical protein
VKTKPRLEKGSIITLLTHRCCLSLRVKIITENLVPSPVEPLRFHSLLRSGSRPRIVLPRVLSSRHDFPVPSHEPDERSVLHLTQKPFSAVRCRRLHVSISPLICLFRSSKPPRDSKRQRHPIGRRPGQRAELESVPAMPARDGRQKPEGGWACSLSDFTKRRFHSDDRGYPCPVASPTSSLSSLKLCAKKRQHAVSPCSTHTCAVSGCCSRKRAVSDCGSRKEFSFGFFQDEPTGFRGSAWKAPSPTGSCRT